MPSELQISIQLKLDDRELRFSFEAYEDNVAVLGPSGVGKTTLLRVLAGLEKKARGFVRFKDQVLQDDRASIFVPPWQRNVGWLPQDALLFPHLTVFKNLSFSGATPEVVKQISSLLNISHLLPRRPRHLSGGEKQRVALGRALASQPQLLLLDEPFSALDEALRADLIVKVSNFCEVRRICLVLVTHNSSEAKSLCREVWHLSTGLVHQVALENREYNLPTVRV